MEVYSTERGICATHEAERMAQPIRLAAGVIGGPAVIYISEQLPPDRRWLRLAGGGLGLACTAWNLWVWKTVREHQR